MVTAGDCQGLGTIPRNNPAPGQEPHQMSRRTRRNDVGWPACRRLAGQRKPSILPLSGGNLQHGDGWHALSCLSCCLQMLNNNQCISHPAAGNPQRVSPTGSPDESLGRG